MWLFSCELRRSRITRHYNKFELFQHIFIHGHLKMLIKSFSFYICIQPLKIHIFISTVGVTVETCVKKIYTVGIIVEIGVKKINKWGKVISTVWKKNKLNILSTIIKC